jgi:hypothetical protein
MHTARAADEGAPVIAASCHCGAVRIEIPHAPEAVTSCNCSICRRLGALWAFYPIDQVRIEYPQGASESYVWGEGTRRFFRCRHCGCTTHVYPVHPKPQSQVEVNARLFEPPALGPFRVRLFDGADTWKYVGEITAPPAGGGH